MKVTIEGDLEQVAEALNPSLLETPTPRTLRLRENRAKRDEFIARRRLVSDAFKKIRHSENDRETSEALLDALRRTGGVTDGDLKLARKVLAAAQ